MKTIYLHIGHYKTGTSAFQRYCSDNARALKENGYLYPPVARPKNNRTNHGDLSLTLAAKHGFVPPAWYSDEKHVDDVYQEFLECVRGAEQDKILVSSEEFLQLALRQDSDAALSELRDRMDDFDVNILFCIREPLSLLKSWYNEVNKGGHGTRNFTVFFRNLNPNFLGQHLVYERFAEVFGADRMIVRTYQHQGMDHIRDMLQGIGYGPLPEKTEKAPRVQVAQDLGTLELARLSKRRDGSFDEATLSEFKTLRVLGRKVDRINAEFRKISALSDTPRQSELSLVNIFRHLQALLTPVVESRCANDKEADILRDAALEAETFDLELALVLMQTAQLVRPSGAFINRKVREYEQMSPAG